MPESERAAGEAGAEDLRSTAAPAGPGEPGEACHYWQYCVNCGTRLQSRKCKLFCPKCGFYHSCSEP